MTKKDEALRLAHEVLWKARAMISDLDVAHKEIGNAMSAIREALAQPEQEPVAGVKFDCFQAVGSDCWYDCPDDAEIISTVIGREPRVGDEYEVLASIRAVPVRYRVVSVEDDDFGVECISNPVNDTAPPLRDLTDEEIDKIRESFGFRMLGFFEFARAINAAMNNKSSGEKKK